MCGVHSWMWKTIVHLTDLHPSKLESMLLFVLKFVCFKKWRSHINETFATKLRKALLGFLAYIWGSVLKRNMLFQCKFCATNFPSTKTFSILNATFEVLISLLDHLKLELHFKNSTKKLLIYVNHLILHLICWRTVILCWMSRMWFEIWFKGTPGCTYILCMLGKKIAIHIRKRLILRSMMKKENIFW